MEIKYTADGKKIAIMSFLNEDECVAQEIIIKNGEEIVDGEVSIVQYKKLLNEPVLTWKASQLNKIETEYNTKYDKYNRDLKALEEEFTTQSKLIKKKIVSINSLIKNFDETDLNRLVTFISGDFTHVVTSDYLGLEIKLFNDVLHYERGEMKLLTVFGKSDGKLNYRINEYSDGSGSSNKMCVPFTSYEEALEYIINHYNEFLSSPKLVLNETIYKNCLKYGINIPNDKLNEYFNTQENSIKKQLDKNKEANDKLNIQLQKIRDGRTNNS